MLGKESYRLYLTRPWTWYLCRVPVRTHP